jgi:hypothetical protein
MTRTTLPHDVARCAGVTIGLIEGAPGWKYPRAMVGHCTDCLRRTAPTDAVSGVWMHPPIDELMSTFECSYRIEP